MEQKDIRTINSPLCECQCAGVRGCASLCIGRGVLIPLYLLYFSLNYPKHIFNIVHHLPVIKP